MASNVKKNDELTLKVEAIAGNGNGICKIDDGFVIFVPCAAPNEIIKAHVIKVTKSYAVAKIMKIIQPSPYRNEDGCPFAGSCGGCSFQQISYAEECKFKEKSINDALARIGGLDICVEKFHGAENINGYRNKAVYPIGVDKTGKAVSGFYAAGSHRIVCHDRCLISNPKFVKIRDFILDFINKNSISVYDEHDGSGLMRSVYLRSAESGDTGLTLIINEENGKMLKWFTEFVKKVTDAFPEIKSVCVNYNSKNTNVILGDCSINLFGDGYIYDELCGKKFRINHKSFWQVNRNQAQVLYTVAKEFADLKKGDVLADLYCGTGSVGICVSDETTKLYGAEIVEEAANDAAFNARLNGIDGVFAALPAEDALSSPFLTSIKPNVITIDPPRKGCVGSVEKIAALGAEKIVYISCDPATLARDLALFSDCGYAAKRVRAVDMFPRTGHVECVVCLTLK